MALSRQLRAPAGGARTLRNGVKPFSGARRVVKARAAEEEAPAAEEAAPLEAAPAVEESSFSFNLSE